MKRLIKWVLYRSPGLIAFVPICVYLSYAELTNQEEIV
jgi:hypothetical protein